MAFPVPRMPLQATERRLNQRFPIGIPLQYKLFRYGRVVNSGKGQTLNLSSGGALIKSEVALPKGLEVELSIAWPARLDGVVGLSLVAVGKIVRIAGSRTAVAFSRHYSRTRNLQKVSTIPESFPTGVARGGRRGRTHP